MIIITRAKTTGKMRLKLNDLLVANSVLENATYLTFPTTNERVLLRVFHARNGDFVTNFRVNSFNLRIIIILRKLLVATYSMSRRMASGRIGVDVVEALVVSRSMVDVLLLRAWMIPVKLIHELRRLLELRVLESIVGCILHWKTVVLASKSATLTSLNGEISILIIKS